jgi:GT2 family glycosyltransferase
MVDPVPVSTVIPTIGRPRLLRRCLESIGASNRLPDEVLIVDQSRGDEIARAAMDVLGKRARIVACEGTGVALALNTGLREARHDTVLVTHDDCHVHPSWVKTGWELIAAHPGCIVTGRVLPAGDPRAVPSTRDDPEPHDYTGELHCGVLYPNNMALSRSLVLEFGGFDPFVDVAEDNDLCYRWLRAGRCLRYTPELVVWHHDWRTPEELERLYVTYWRAQGRLYAKHLAAGDAYILRLLARDIRAAFRGSAAAALRRTPRWTDWRQGAWRGLLPGLLGGLVEVRQERKQ